MLGIALDRLLRRRHGLDGRSAFGPLAEFTLNGVPANLASGTPGHVRLELDVDGRYAIQVLGPDGRAQARRIEIGLDDQSQVEVKTGLSEGEQVVLGEAEPGAPRADQRATSSQKPASPAPAAAN